ncbi:MAG: glycosyltransferase family 39 protein [Blastocatellia bacterium]|nr:glycosyltransferase family 39 protein [Blastocatellia bacterium]
MKFSYAKRSYLLALVLALAVMPYFVNLGASSLWDSNEAFYAETPRVMIESGDYLNPSFNSQPRFNKPPLCYWVVAAFYRVFGVSEATERLPIALGAMIIIGAAFALGRALFSIEAGLLSAIAMALSPRFLMFSRRIIIDVYLAMFCALVLLFFVLAFTRPRSRRLYLLLMYVSAGLGVLTKGPVAAILPAAAFFIYLAFTRSLGKLREMMLPAGFLIVAAIVLPWYAAIYSEHGWLYIKSFLLDDNISRYTEPVWGPRRSLFFYLPVVIGDMFPWSLFLLMGFLVAAIRALKRSRGAGETRRRGDAETRRHGDGERGFAASVIARGAREQGGYHPSTPAPLHPCILHPSSFRRPAALLVIWVAVIVVFFSISRNKEDLYILPIYPAAAALVGGMLARLPRERQPARSPLGWTTAILGILLAAGGAAVLYLFRQAYELAGSDLIGYVALGGGLLAVAAVLMRKEFAAVLWTAATVIAINWVFVLATLPDFERYKPARAFSEIIAAAAAPDALVGYYRFASPSMSFYLRRPVFEYYEPEQLRAAFASGRQVYCLITAEDYESIKAALPSATLILARQPVFRLKLRGILDRTELPQVLLITGVGGATGSQ